MLFQYAFRLDADFIGGGACRGNFEMTYQPLFDVRMQMALYSRPRLLTASDENALAGTVFIFRDQPFAYLLEMLAGLVFDLSFSVTGVVTREPIAASVTRKFIKETLLLGDLVHV